MKKIVLVVLVLFGLVANMSAFELSKRQKKELKTCACKREVQTLVACANKWEKEIKRAESMKACRVLIDFEADKEWYEAGNKGLEPLLKQNYYFAKACEKENLFMIGYIDELLSQESISQEDLDLYYDAYIAYCHRQATLSVEELDYFLTIKY